MRRSIPRRALLLTVAFVLPVSLVGLVGATAASAAKSPPFKGPAVGTVTCKGVTVKVTFTPPATSTTGGNSFSVKGKFSSCTVSNAPAGVTEVIQQGKVTGGGKGNGGGCNGFATPSNNNISLTIVWKGKYNGGKATFTNTTATLVGEAAAVDGSGNIGFEVPNPGDSGSSVSGSFAGPTTDESFLYSSQGITAINTLCSGKHGLKKLNLTHGTVIVP